MIRRRQTGSGNWSRGIFAAFWILLGCVSGLYLFNVLTDPTLGSQLVGLTPSGSGETTASAGGNASPKDQLASIEENLRALSQQVANLSGKLEGSETSDAPAAPEPAEAALPSSAPPETEAAGAEPPAPSETPEPAPVQAEAPQPAAPPQPEAAPVEQAALEPAQSPAAAPPAPPQPAGPPPVAVAPLENLPDELQERANAQPEAAPAPSAAALAEAPAAAQPPAEAAPGAAGSPAAEAAAMAPPQDAAPEPQEPAAAATPPSTETAALDPIQLPPAANDGSTRYGIEIGVVAKQDGLRPLWREYLTNHAALVAGLQPRRVLAPDKKWRLIAGPFTSAEEAAQACALFKKAARPCEATVYAGDSL
ncbi:MAG: SPOR domain-containing protein [Methyloceanibacter sp.]